MARIGSKATRLPLRETVQLVAGAMVALVSGAVVIVPLSNGIIDVVIDLLCNEVLMVVGVTAAFALWAFTTVSSIFGMWSGMMIGMLAETVIRLARGIRLEVSAATEASKGRVATTTCESIRMLPSSKATVLLGCEAFSC